MKNYFQTPYPYIFMITAFLAVLHYVYNVAWHWVLLPLWLPMVVLGISQTVQILFPKKK